jgi:AraC-like DNA-binding protein
VKTPRHADVGTRFLRVRPGVGLTANVIQCSGLRFSRIVVDRPALILLQHGRKTLQSGGRRWTVHGGEAVALAGGQSFDVFNQLSAAGHFEARWIVWDTALLERHPQAPSTQPLSGAAVLKAVEPAFVEAIGGAVEAICDSAAWPQAVAQHRLAELLVWLSLHGIGFAPPTATSVSTRLRRMFAQALSEPWTTARGPSELAMSEATLRRRLASEDASFADLLADVRMSHAMTLLQSTDHSVARIASDVGYESPSRFAVRFRERFGFAPTAIRGHDRRGPPGEDRRA